MSAALFVGLLKSFGVPAPVAEYRFHPTRRWRFDYAWPAQRVALEVEGGAWIRGRHTRGAGFVADLEKYNEAAAAGWRVLRVTPDRLATVDSVRLIERIIEVQDPVSHSVAPAEDQLSRGPYVESGLAGQ